MFPFFNGGPCRSVNQWQQSFEETLLSLLEARKTMININEINYLLQKHIFIIGMALRHTTSNIASLIYGSTNFIYCGDSVCYIVLISSDNLLMNRIC